LTALKPDILINAGTAGGFKARGGSVGDVFITTASRHHDRSIEIPVFDAYGIWETSHTPATRLADELGFKLGMVSTGNSLNCSERDREVLDASGAHVKEMECASIAMVATLFKTPFFAVKALTDIVDGDRVSGASARPQLEKSTAADWSTHSVGEEFQENLAMAANALRAALPRVVEYLSTRTVDEL
jgi:5'-methylthioadenosine nucleosidase